MKNRRRGKPASSELLSPSASELASNLDEDKEEQEREDSLWHDLWERDNFGDS
jgi:hypothetical protein